MPSPSITRRTILMGAALAASGMSMRSFAAPRPIRLAVGGRSALYYLPLTIAEQKGFFSANGIQMEIFDFAGGSKALQALLGGSADLGVGSFEHVISMHAKGQPIEAVSVMSRNAGVVIALRQDRAAKYRGPASLAEMKLGVTAPGSGTHMFLKSWLARNKVAPDSVPVIGVGSGAGAIAAFRQGELDGIVNLDPIISQLEIAGNMRILVDGRLNTGMEAAYGGPYAAATLFAQPDYIAKNTEAVQGCVNAIQQALQWMSTATPEAIAAMVPRGYYSDVGLYQVALKKNLSGFAPRIQMNDTIAANVFRALSGFDPQINGKTIAYSKTYTNRFVSVPPAQAGSGGSKA